jgi:hypothetical protein
VGWLFLTPIISQSYVTVAGAATSSVGITGSSYLQKYRFGIANHLQVFFVIGAVLASFLSSWLAHNMSLSQVSKQKTYFEKKKKKQDLKNKENKTKENNLF